MLFSRSLHEAQLRFVPVTCVVAMIFFFYLSGNWKGEIFYHCFFPAPTLAILKTQLTAALLRAMFLLLLICLFCYKFYPAAKKQA